MNIQELKSAMAAVRTKIDENSAYLTELDQQNGDGDLGISMSAGFAAACAFLDSTDEVDLGKAFMKCSGAFNEAAPSTLGTIMSLGLMGMAKALKCKIEADDAELSEAFSAGLSQIMERAKSKPGDKTILDSLCPAAAAWKDAAVKGRSASLAAAAAAARAGSEATRGMKSVHGRAAYYGEKSIGILDGGAVVGSLLFESLSSWASCAEKEA